MKKYSNRKSAKYFLLVTPLSHNPCILAADRACLRFKYCTYPLCLPSCGALLQLQSRARQQLHELHLAKLKRAPTGSGYTHPSCRVGEPCGSFMTSPQSSRKEISKTRDCSVDSAWSSLGDVAAAWLGGGGRVCNGERSRGRGDSGGEWRGAFTNRELLVAPRLCRRVARSCPSLISRRRLRDRHGSCSNF